MEEIKLTVTLIWHFIVSGVNKKRAQIIKVLSTLFLQFFNIYFTLILKYGFFLK